MNRPDFDYMCICVNGWTGKDCSINIDDCAKNPCYNNGTCLDHTGYYTCMCPVGITGKSLLIIQYSVKNFHVGLRFTTFSLFHVITMKLFDSISSADLFEIC